MSIGIIPLVSERPGQQLCVRWTILDNKNADRSHDRAWLPGVIPSKPSKPGAIVEPTANHSLNHTNRRNRHERTESEANGRLKVDDDRKIARGALEFLQRLRREIVFLDLCQKSLVVNAKDASGLGLVAVLGDQHTLDMGPLDIFEGRAIRRRRRGLATVYLYGIEVFYVKHLQRIRSEQHQSLEDVS